MALRAGPRLWRRQNGESLQFFEVTAQGLRTDESVLLLYLVDVTRRELAEKDADLQRRIFAAQNDDAPDAVSILLRGDAPSYANTAARKALGLADAVSGPIRARALIEQGLTIVVEPPSLLDRTVSIEADQASRSDTVRLGDGRVFERLSSPIHGARGDLLGWVKTYRNVTEQERTINELRASEERLKVLLGCTQGIVFEFDADGRCVEVWTNDEQLLALPRSGVIGRTLTDVLGAAAGPYLDVIRRVLQTGRSEVLEYEMEVMGGPHWFRGELFVAPAVPGASPTVAMLTRDITTQRLAEEARKNSEASFHTLIDRLPDGVLIREDSTIVYANPALVKCLGYSQQGELIGRHFLDLFLPEDHEAIHRFRREREMGRPDTDSFERRVLRRDGTVVLVEGQLLTLLFEGKQATALILRDLTEQRELQSRLMMADRMVSVGTLAAGVAHEINNPLSFITMNVGHILRQLEEHGEMDRDELVRALRDAHDGGNRVRQIVRDLKTFSRSDEEKLEPVNLQRVAEVALNMGWNEIRHRAQLEEDFQPTPNVLGNEARLGQVVLNLIVNAAQAIQEGDAAHNVIQVSVYATDKNEAAISIRDTGCGIQPEILERIFEPFFTTKPIGIGTGLGLSICRNIVTSMGGHIMVDSTPGLGTTFTVTLPIAPAQAATSLPTAVEKLLAAPRARVLIIDDEPALGRVLARMLRADHDAEIAGGGREALERIRSGQRYDAILCDVMMPDVTGLDVFHGLEASAPAQARRMIFMTGGAFTPQARSFMEGRQASTVEKPIDPARLRQALSELLDREGLQAKAEG